MGDVISMDLFRDRRKGGDGIQVISGAMDPHLMTKAELHDHLRNVHAWGGPKSMTKNKMLTTHHNSHADPAGFEKPHSHGGA